MNKTWRSSKNTWSFDDTPPHREGRRTVLKKPPHHPALSHFHSLGVQMVEKIEEIKRKFDRKNMILLGIFLLILAFVL